MPVSGRITYWESISSAATLDFMRQQRHGVEGSVGMSSGDRVIQISPAESSGFILAFSSGRLAHLMVRDGHGRPAVSVNMLGTHLGPAHSNIFGSIRQVFSHSAGRGDIAAVRVEQSTRVGQRNVTAGTIKGKLVSWTFHRGGHYETIVEADLRSQILQAVTEVDRQAAEFPVESLELLDFTYVPRGLEQKYRDMSSLSNAIESEESSVQHLLLLTSLTRNFTSRYFLVEAVLSPSDARIGMTRPISCYTTPPSSKASITAVRPRIHLPRPGLVAFLVFSRAAVVASIAIPPNSPDAQLEDSTISKFEDVIDLQDNSVLEIIGSGFEEPGHDDGRSHRHKTKNPTAILMVRDAGLLRITTTDVDKFASDRGPKVTAKSKLEQAVFYGAKPNNPLLFDARRDVQFSHGELGEAAVELSRDILSSSNQHIGTLPFALEENLQSRSAALGRLIRHLASSNVAMDRRTRWTLLWNAEKMAVAAEIWRSHMAFVSERPAEDKKTLVSEIVEFIHEDHKNNPNQQIGEVDRVRHWFLHDVWRLEIFVAWAYEVIKHLYKGQVLDEEKLAVYMAEAVTINVAALRGGLDFRRNNLKLYGLENEADEHGIINNYDGLPEPWTGSTFISNNIKRLLELCHQWLQQYLARPSDTSVRMPSASTLAGITGNIAPLTDYCLLSILEQSRWGATSPDPKKVKFAETCAEIYNSARHEKIMAMESLELWDDAERIAEKHSCWPALADTIISHIHSLRAKALAPALSRGEEAELLDEAERLETKLQVYFDKLGQEFAFAAYDVLLERDGVPGVLDFKGDKLGYRTEYLRTRPDLAKIAWIHDVEKEDDITQAAETLLDLGLSREQQVWNKKIELSLGKLALMADDCPGDDGGAAVGKFSTAEARAAKVNEVDQVLLGIRIQENVYNEIYASVRSALDEPAELLLAMEVHGNLAGYPNKHKVLRQILESGIQRLLKHEALDAMSLIDVLTLSNFAGEIPDGEDEEPAVTVHRFFDALRIADISLRGEEYKAARRLIWRRCYIREDWAGINETELKTDYEISDHLAQTLLYHTAGACYERCK
jgi:nuclear pore complex protein Nup133